MDKSLLEDIASDLGTAMVVLLLCAQLPAMRQVVFVTKRIENLSIVPTVGQFTNFVSWTVYGLLSGNLAVLRVNAIGIGFSLVYMTLFLMYTKDQAWYHLVYALSATMVIFGSIFVLVCLPGWFSKSEQITITGALSVGCNVVMYGSPLVQMRTALKLMDANVIPLLLTLTGTGCSLCWLAFGLMTDNWFVAGPNVAGTLLSILQIGVALYIYWHVRQDHAHKVLSESSGVEDEGVGTQYASDASANSTTALARKAAGKSRAGSGGATPYTPLPSHDV